MAAKKDEPGDLPAELARLSPAERESVRKLLAEKSAEAAAGAQRLLAGPVDPGAHASGGTRIPLPGAASTSEFDFAAIDAAGRSRARVRELGALIDHLVAEHDLAAPAEELRQRILAQDIECAARDTRARVLELLRA